MKKKNLNTQRSSSIPLQNISAEGPGSKGPLDGANVDHSGCANIGGCLMRDQGVFLVLGAANNFPASFRCWCFRCCFVHGSPVSCSDLLSISRSLNVTSRFSIRPQFFGSWLDQGHCPPRSLGDCPHLPELSWSRVLFFFFFFLPHFIFLLHVVSLFPARSIRCFELFIYYHYFMIIIGLLLFYYY